MIVHACKPLVTSSDDVWDGTADAILYSMQEASKKAIDAKRRFLLKMAEYPDINVIIFTQGQYCQKLFANINLVILGTFGDIWREK